MENTNQVKFPGFTLVHAANPAGVELDQLAQAWDFPVLHEAATPAKRSHFETYPASAYLVTLWPTYRKSTRDIRPVELSFFIRPEVLIIVQRGELPAYTAVVRQYAASSELRQQMTERTPERLLYLILSAVYQSLFPMINHLIDDCDIIEHEIFSDHQRRMISQILSLRRNITDVRKILQTHKLVLRRLATYVTDDPRYVMNARDRYFNDLIDYAREDWDILENLKERIEALQQTNESQISFRMSDIMKTLTIISVFTFPLTLVAATFALNADGGMPWQDSPYGFWYVVATQAALAAVMLAFFKRKRWF